MRKDRYITSDEVADIDRLTEMTWAVDLKNTVSIRWTWPRNGGIKLAAVFSCDEPGTALESLLESGSPVIITKDMDKSFSRTLERACAYRVFPAHFGDGADIVILNQTTGNSTDIITKVVTVDYKIEYRPLPLSEYQRVELTVRCSGPLPDPKALAYAKYRNGARVCDYPAAPRDGEYICYIKKNEIISLYAADEYAENVVLRKS